MVKSVTLKEILPFEQYEILRPRLRPLFLADKERHRLALGNHMTLLFENGQSVWYQIQEMVRTERLTAENAIRHEIDTYNDLLPRAGELAATMLIEYPDPQERDSKLRRLVGLEQHLWIRIGERREQARFDSRQMATDRISSVQFVRFRLGGLEPEEFAAMARHGKIEIEVDHPELRVTVAITGEIASALARDLAVD
ncbi:MAG TPA: DUF3501 family protein [Candidatus Binataceae bacterium]|nr:DUF3501 family protein [Candidatus Binataceae bacterium]